MSDDSDIMNDMLENTDLLNKILQNRLDQHISKRIEHQKTYHNFALSWFRDNLSRFSAWVTLNRHVIEDLSRWIATPNCCVTRSVKILALLK